jgi:thiamine monophosphate synthase
MRPDRGSKVGTNDEAPATAFDALVARMRRDVKTLEARDEGGLKESSARLQHILDAAVREARAKVGEARAAVADGLDDIHDGMKAHPAATVSAAFAAGYLIGKSIAGRTKS